MKRFACPLATRVQPAITPKRGPHAVAAIAGPIRPASTSTTGAQLIFTTFSAPPFAADTPTIRPTHHAIERWAERVRIGQELSTQHAREDLVRCCQAGRPSITPPAWLQFSKADGYLLLGDDICLPVAQDVSGELVALTVLTKWDADGVYVTRRRHERSARVRNQRRKHHEGPAAKRRRSTLMTASARTVPWAALQRAATHDYVIKP